jgi:hypothetical protein
MARALTHGKQAFDIVFAGGGADVTKYGVAEAERLAAGFDAGEVRVAADLAAAKKAALEARTG